LLRGETLALEVSYGSAPEGAVGKVGEGTEVRVLVSRMAGKPGI
jgi:hypothetical protein